jgi:hypothetical protein
MRRIVKSLIGLGRHLRGFARYGAFNPTGTRTMDSSLSASMRELDKGTVLVEFSCKHPRLLPSLRGETPGHGDGAATRQG